MSNVGKSVLERFEMKVDRSGECWLWTAGMFKKTGYGKFHPDRSLTVYAHRWSYEQFVGSIPKGLQIDHLCRVRHCVNPAHLEPVTRRVNILRGEGFAARYAAQTHCFRGHPFDLTNTYVVPRTGQRQCRACRKVRNAQRAAA